jgi:replication factor C small subunit
MAELWTEKYRPKTLDEYVWRDPQQRDRVEAWLADKAVPNVLFSGIQGTGKTSLAKLILRLLDIQPGDILEVNASKERNLDVVREKISNFVSTWPIGNYDYKYILLEEADYMNPMAQAALRVEMEKYSNSARFVFTANYPNKIIPALHSRLQTQHFMALDREAFRFRLLTILLSENIAVETEETIELVEEFINQNYPDLRKCINLVQQNCRKGKLEPPSVAESSSKDYVMEMINLFRAGEFLEARKLIVAQAQPEQYTDIYRVLYRNLDVWGDEAAQDKALMIIRQGLVNHALVADVEINLAATICELQLINS